MFKNIPGPGNDQKLAVIDEKLRKTISSYYFSLKELNDPEKAIKLLAQHVSIMVEMINEFKESR